MKSSAPLSEFPIKRFDLPLTELNQAVRKFIPFLLAGALACTVMLPANAITPTESGAVNATIDLVRQFSQRVSLAQSAGYLDEQISEVNGAPRAARMAPIPLNFAPADVRPVPPITGLPRRDGAGRPLGYCAWDNTSATNVSISGTLAYLAGNIPGNSDKLVYAVISPGRDGRIETSCADVLLLQQTIQSERGGGLGDDLVYARRPLQKSSRTFRANVGTQSGLPVSDNTEGDVRLVMDTNTLYAYNGGSWQAIGGDPAERFTGDGSGNLSYTGGKVTVADFEATTATLSASLTVNGTTALNGITSITGATTVNGAFTATTLSGSAAGLTDLNANNIASGTLAVARGGTGLGTAPALNQVLIGNGTGYGLSTVTAGTGIGVTNAGGLLTISNTGLLSISSPMSTVNVSTTNGVVTLDLPQSVATTATPTFGGMMLNGGLTGTTASFTGAITASRLDVSTSAGGVTNPNMIVGFEAMQGTPSGDGANTTLGIKGLRNNTTGAFNVAVGSDSQSANTTGGYNVGVGIQTLLNSTTGINNTALGSFAGDTNTSGGNNTLLGYAADVAAGNLSYSTAIGASSVVATSNTVAIGRNSTADQVVIGTDTRNDTTANTKLYVNGISRFNGMQYGTSSTYSGTVTANLFSGSGASLTNLSAGNISSGTLAVARGGTGLGTTPTNGQLLIGNGAGYALATLTGTANQVSVANGAGSVTLSLPQNIATTSTPTFGGMTLNGGLTGTTSNFSGRVDAGSVYIGGSQVLPLTRANINSTMTFATSNLTLGTSNFTDLDEALRNVTIGIGGMPALRDGSDNAGLGYQSLVTLRDGSGNTALGSRALDSIRDGNNNTAIGAFADVTNDSLDYAAAIGASSTVATSNTMALGRSGNADQIVVGTSSRNDTYANTKLYVNGISNFNGGMYGTAGTFSGTVNANLFSGSGASLTNLNAGNISSGTLHVARGGTGLGATPTNGQLLIGNGTGYTLGTLTGTANQVVVTNSAGGVTLSLPQSIAVTSTPTFGGMTLTGGLTGTTGTFSGAVTAATLSAARLNVGTSVGVGTSNLIVGNGAMSGVQSGNGGNTALGTNALASNSTGYYNIAVGEMALVANTTGDTNISIGYQSMYDNTSGHQNVAMGYLALSSNTGGIANNAIGYVALGSNTTGYDNIAFGVLAGISNSTGYSNTFLGARTNATSGALTYASAIGAESAVSTSNTLVLGRTSDVTVIGATGDNGSGDRLQVTGSSGVSGNVILRNSGTGTTTGSKLIFGGIGEESDTVYFGRINASPDTTILQLHLADNPGTAVGAAGDRFQIVTGSGPSTIDGPFSVRHYFDSDGSAFHVGALSVGSLVAPRLDITNSTGVSIANMIVGGGAGGNRRIYLGPDNTDGGGGDEVYFRYYVRGGEATTLEMYSGNDADDHININPSLGNVGIGVESPGAKLHVNGGVLATSYSTSSDRRLKSNILALDSDDLLSRLSGVVAHRYNYIAHPEVGTRIGVIAQEIQALFPEVATYNKDNFMSVDYNALGAMAAAGLGRLNSKFNAFEKFTKDKFDSVDKEIASLKTETAKIKGLEDWREVANTRMDTMQSSIDKNLAKITENTLAIEKNTAQIKRLDDVLVTLDTTVKGQGEAIDGINTRWGKTFTASEDGTMLTVTAAELKVNNFTAQQVRTNSLYTARLEAEMAKIKELDIDRLRANSAVANTLQAEQMNTGAAQVYAGVGAPAFLFSASTDGHYTVNTSALDGSYATATVIVNAGQAKIIPIANEGIQLMAVGNTVKAIAAGKGIKATWIKMG
jgi:trimeric autotransporter adhesin